MISVIQKEKIQEYYNFFYLKNIKKIIKNEKIEYNFYSLEEMNSYFSLDSIPFYRSINYNKDLFSRKFQKKYSRLLPLKIKNILPCSQENKEDESKNKILYNFSYL